MMAAGSIKGLGFRGKPLIHTPLPLIGIIVGVPVLGRLKGGGLLITGLHHEAGCSQSPAHRTSVCWDNTDPHMRNPQKL